MAGDPHSHVAVVDYDPAWVRTFEEQRDAIMAAVQTAGQPVALVEHVGSTAVPGLAAKPIIDIMVCYAQLPELASILAPLAAIGYAYVPRPDFTESYFFRRGDTFESIIHLHVTTLTSEFGLQMVRFRDALRASPALAADYAAFKRALAEQFPDDRPAYTAAKGPFVSRATASTA
jgi:GrpB-like predicted nucleotidyltransferase (UPF0157 family)